MDKLFKNWYESRYTQQERTQIEWSGHKCYLEEGFEAGRAHPNKHRVWPACELCGKSIQFQDCTKTSDEMHLVTARSPTQKSDYEQTDEQGRPLSYWGGLKKNQTKT